MYYTAEMWDKMQHVMAKYNDHMAHASIQFEGRLDIIALKKALQIVIDKIPVLKSIYRYNFLGARWEEIKDFEVDSIFETINVKKGEGKAESEKFLLGIIDETCEAQIKVGLVRGEKGDYLNFLINHMCMDGADIKEFLFLVAKVYTNLVTGIDEEVYIKQGTRSESQLYNGFSEKEREDTMNLVSYSKKQKSKLAYPFETTEREKLSPKIITYKVDAELFSNIKKISKKMGVSINDVAMGAFYRATLNMIETKNGQTLGLPAMVDLRRYIKSGKSEGFCNLTSMIVPNLGEDIGEDIFETVQKIRVNMDELKENYPGLHGMPLLRKVFELAPYGIARFLIGTFFKNPLIGVSNIGIVDEERLVFGEVKVADVMMTGSVKYPPYMQLAFSTFRGEITYTVAIYGTPNDYAMMEKMFGIYDAEIKKFAKGK